MTKKVLGSFGAEAYSARIRSSCLYCGKCFQSQGQLGELTSAQLEASIHRDANQNLDLMESLYHSDMKQDQEPQTKLACFLLLCQRVPLPKSVERTRVRLWKAASCWQELSSPGAQEDVEVLVTCLYCCQKFLNPDQLKDHQCTLWTTKRLVVRVPSKIRLWSGALKDHDRGDKWQLPTPETRRYKCPDCDKRSKNSIIWQSTSNQYTETSTFALIVAKL